MVVAFYGKKYVEYLIMTAVVHSISGGIRARATAIDSTPHCWSFKLSRDSGDKGE